MKKKFNKEEKKEVNKVNKKKEIEVDTSQIEAEYSNTVNIKHTTFDFVFDFIQVFPPQAKLVARVVMSPQHTKAFLEALKENLAKYEAAYGKIVLPAKQESQPELH